MVCGFAMCVGLNAREAGPSSIERCAEWLESAGRAQDAPGQRPVLAWLYPPTPLHRAVASDPPASVRVVARLEAAVQQAAFLAPRTFRDDDFFPLTRESFADGPTHAILADASQYTPVARFGPRDEWWMTIAFLGARPPFPLNALLQPELSVYAPREADPGLRSAD